MSESADSSSSCQYVFRARSIKTAANTSNFDLILILATCAFESCVENFYNVLFIANIHGVKIIQINYNLNIY